MGVSLRQQPHTHPLEDKATQQQLPSITVFHYLHYLIPAHPAQIFLFSIDNFPPRDLRPVAPSLAFGDPGLSNSAVVVLLSFQDMTDSSPSPDLHSLCDGILMEFTVDDGVWPKYAKGSP